MTHDAVDRDVKVTAPLLALWGSDGVVGRSYDVLATWREMVTDVSGGALPCGHYLPEEVPEAVASALVTHLAPE